MSKLICVQRQNHLAGLRQSRAERYGRRAQGPVVLVRTPSREGRQEVPAWKIELTSGERGCGLELGGQMVGWDWGWRQGVVRREV